MCEENPVENNPHEALASLLNRRVTLSNGKIDPASLRDFIRAYWSRLAALAHAIHDEDDSKQKERALQVAAKNVAALTAEGILNVVRGEGASELRSNLCFLAEAITARR